MKIAAGYFNKAIKNEQFNISWPRQSVAAIPFKKEDKSLMELINSKAISVSGLDNFFPVFNVKNKCKTLFTHLGGGIGDVLAFSSLTEYLKGFPIQIHTTERYMPIFDWFKSDNITLKNWFDPIAFYYNPVKFRYMHRISTEFAAVEAGPVNWYKAFYNRIGLDEIPEGFGRPHLRTDRVSNWDPLIPGGTKSILICHRSSCQMRSSRFQDFHLPIIRRDENVDIYVHEVDLMGEDELYIDNYNDIVEPKNRIRILPKDSISQYLLNLYDADMVITTDSAAIHFREGIEKPALGVFAAMTTKSRTSEYKFTKSFNVKSDCEHQPCFIHELIKGQVCKNAEEGDRVAKCQIGEGFQEQLYKALNDYH